MSVESRLHSILYPVFGTELYPIVHPDPDGTESEVSALYAIYIKVGGAKFHTLEGNTDISRPRMQISIYSVDFDEMLTKEAAVVAAMNAANIAASVAVDSGLDPLVVEGSLPNIAISVPTHGRESDTDRFYSHMEYYVWDRS